MCYAYFTHSHLKGDIHFLQKVNTYIIMTDQGPEPPYMHMYSINTCILLCDALHALYTFTLSNIWIYMNYYNYVSLIILIV